MKYKKLTIILIIFLVALFLSPLLDVLLLMILEKFGIYGAIFIGYFYSFAFTSGAVSVMLSGVKEEYLLFSILAALGAMLADLTILKIINISLKEELESLGNLNFVKKISKLSSLRSNKLYLVFGFMVIGSPLPDELGVWFLSKFKLSQFKFLLLCFLANLFFIYFLARI